MSEDIEQVLLVVNTRQVTLHREQSAVDRWFHKTLELNEGKVKLDELAYVEKTTLEVFNVRQYWTGGSTNDWRR